MTSFYFMMKKINKLMNNGVKELNKSDVEKVFDREADCQLKEEFEYLGLEVNMVADLFNVKMPDSKFTKDELNKQKFIEEHY